MYRDVTMKEISESHIGQLHQAAGWAENIRDHGGVPFAIKDNLCTEGTCTTCSSKILENFIPVFSAEAVVKLEEAGAVIRGFPLVYSLPVTASGKRHCFRRRMPMNKVKRNKFPERCMLKGRLCAKTAWK